MFQSESRAERQTHKKQIFELQQLILLNHNVGVFEIFKLIC